MEWLNYHHLYYFSVIAQELNVTRAAKKLKLSQSNLSEQLKTLENHLGQPLFLRERRRLKLTESGRVTLEYANSIFSTGQELLSVFRGRHSERTRQIIRVGATGPLSKNLQMEFIRPLVGDPGVQCVMVQAPLTTLARELKNHNLDVILSNMSLRTDEDTEVYNHRLGEVDVYLVGRAQERWNSKKTIKTLDGIPLFLPTRESRVRADFDEWALTHRIALEVSAEVEDMALLRLFALSGRGLALVPEIVVRPELKEGRLVRVRKIPGIKEHFFAITATRKFPNPRTAKLIGDFAARIKKGV